MASEGFSQLPQRFTGFDHDVSTEYRKLQRLFDACSPWLRRYCEACSAETQIENRYVLCRTAF